MSMSDPIADMLTRIRNATLVKKSRVSVPASRIKAAIAEALKAEGYIDDFEFAGDGAKRELQLRLKYFRGRPVIEEITRVSSPGCRIYARSDDLPSVRGGLGVALISTSKGVLTDQAARRAGVGGEVLCTVF
ncbi:MAG: 30S ribosomal protein S8 [Gammaproteobacteria bacterium]|nr:30S ribosomal protein S8 [Gammaproteobacteria bacterium]MDD9883865.1 30S ribosomal protein S8 [Gammaproteobacteria bacterium]